MRKALLAALLVITLGACGDDGVTIQHLDPIEIHGLHIRYPTVDGFRRSYGVFVPESVDFNGPPVAAVFMLHGYPPVDMSVVTGLNESALEGGFVAVYPKTSQQGEWAMACELCSPNAVQGVDDVHYLRLIAESLPVMMNVDPARLYLTGFSAGGIMTFRAACDLSNVFAAFAPVSGGMWTWHRDNCDPERRAPMLMIHGTEDQSFPWEGVVVSAPLVGNDRQLPVLETVGLWKESNGCGSGAPTVSMLDPVDDGTSVARTAYSGCSAETLFYRIDGGGHTWAGGPVDLNPGLGVKSLDLPATDSIVAFFLRQSR